MYTAGVVKQKPFLLIVSLAMVVTLVLTSCGTNPGTKTGSTGTGTTPTPTPTEGYGASYGCPSDVVNVTPPTPNVLVKPGSASPTITAHTGDVIEFDLSSGHRWTGPTTSQGILHLQTPYGYVWKTGNTTVCVWQFVAQGTGEAQVSFSAQALCKKGTPCPHYALDLPFTVVVK